MPGLPAYSAPCDFRHACACRPSVVSTLGCFLMNRDRRLSNSISVATVRRVSPLSARGAMALAALSGDEQLVIFSRLCNVLDPGVAVAFASASSELWELTQAPRQQLQADHKAAAALGRKAGKQS